MNAYEDYRQSLPTIKIGKWSRWQKLAVRMSKGLVGKMIMKIMFLYEGV